MIQIASCEPVSSQKGMSSHAYQFKPFHKMRFVVATSIKNLYGGQIVVFESMIALRRLKSDKMDPKFEWNRSAPLRLKSHYFSKT